MKHIRNIAIVLLGLIAPVSFAPSPLAEMLAAVSTQISAYMSMQTQAQKIEPQLSEIKKEYIRCFGIDPSEAKLHEVIIAVAKISWLEAGVDGRKFTDLTLADISGMNAEVFLKSCIESTLKALRKIKDGSNLARLVQFAGEVDHAKLSFYELGRHSQMLTNFILSLPERFTEIELDKTRMSFLMIEGFLRAFLKTSNPIESFVWNLPDEKLGSLALLTASFDLKGIDMSCGTPTPAYVQSNFGLVKLLEELCRLFLSEMPESFGTLRVSTTPAETIETPINMSTLFNLFNAGVLKLNSNSVYCVKGYLNKTQRMVLYPPSAEGYDLSIVRSDLENPKDIKIEAIRHPAPYQYSLNGSCLTVSFGAEMIGKMDISFSTDLIPVNGDGLTHNELTHGYYGYVNSVLIPGSLLAFGMKKKLFSSDLTDWLYGRKITLEQLAGKPEELEAYKQTIADDLGIPLGNVEVNPDREVEEGTFGSL